MVAWLHKSFPPPFVQCNMQTPNKSSIKPTRRRRPPDKFEPDVVIRDYSTPRASKKRSRRRGCQAKFSCQSKLNFTQDDKIPVMLSETDMSAIMLRKAVENVSVELLKLMTIAVQVRQDFPTQVKIEMPRYRCLKMRSLFRACNLPQGLIYMFAIIYVILCLQ